MQAVPPEPPAIVVVAPALPDAAVERAYNLTVIDRKRLHDSPSTQLDQLLKDVPGLQLFRRSDSRSAHPTSQGVTLRGLGGNASSRALLILDGVPQTDPFGGWVNWPAYDPASLGEVRVVRGGGSVASGPGALAGIIAMKSLLDPGITASAEFGSRDSLEGRAVGGFRLGGGTLGISARAARGDGFIPVTKATRGEADRPAGYQQSSIRAFWTAPVSEQTDIQLSGLAFRDSRERGLAFTGNRTDGGDASVRMVGKGHWQWTALAYAQARELESSFASVNDDRSAATRVALQDEVPSTSRGASFEIRPPLHQKLQLRFGGDARRSQGESRELYLFVDGEPTRRRRAGGQSQTAGLFAEATADFGALTLSAGARIDRWKIWDGELVEKALATGATLRDEHFGSRGGWRPTARVGALADLGAGFTVTSAAYLGWRLPTLNELFRPFRVGADATAANPLLDPERLSGFELGARYRKGGLSLSATAFANRLNDSIANVTLGQGPGVFPGVGFVAGQYRQRQNVDSVRVRGLEASMEIRRGPLSAGTAASFTDSRIRASGPSSALDGKRPAQTPRLALTASLGWAKDDHSLTIVARHVGRQYEDDLNEDALGSATTLDAFAAWSVQRHIQLFARAENIFDKLVDAGVGNDGSIERATPRTVSIGLRFTRAADRQNGKP